MITRNVFRHCQIFPGGEAGGGGGEWQNHPQLRTPDVTQFLLFSFSIPCIELDEKSVGCPLKCPSFWICLLSHGVI